MLHVNESIVQFLFEFWQSRSHAQALCFFSVDFLLQLACSSLTPRSCWFIETLQSIKDNDLVHLEFPISALQCFSVFRMILATVIGLRSKSDRFYNSWPRKIKLFSIGGICDINNKGWKISGVAWTLLVNSLVARKQPSPCYYSGTNTVSLKLGYPVFITGMVVYLV